MYVWQKTQPIVPDKWLRELHSQRRVSCGGSQCLLVSEDNSSLQSACLTTVQIHVQSDARMCT